MNGLRVKIITVVLAIATSAHIMTFDQQVSMVLHGGSVSTTKSTWELYRYRDTTLMRKAPMKWCPYLAYLKVQKHVTISCHDNKNWLNINADLIDLLSKEAKENKAFAKKFKVNGNRKQKVKTIYKWLRKTKYVAHVKYASNVFKDRQGDCAAIASAFYVLCKAKGIPVRYVIGFNKNDVCHAWNRVKVSGKWYWIDCTSGKWLSKKQFEDRKVMEIW